MIYINRFINLIIYKCKVDGYKNPKGIIGVCGDHQFYPSFSSLADGLLSCKASLSYDLFFRKCVFQ